MSEPKYYTVFEADSAYLKNLGDTNTYFSEFEVRLKTLEALGGTISNGVATLLDVEKAILEQLGGIASAANDIFELRKEIAKAQGLDVSEDFNIWDVAQQEPPVGPKTFTIRFLNWDGSVLETVQVEEGQTPVYGGTEPTKESDETYDYTFNGWLPEISAANGNVDYVAQFTATEIGPKIFTIVFKNWDGTVLQTVEVEEGQTPVYSGSTPTKESDDTYDYTFDGWNPDISPATGNVEYVAKYIATEIPSGPEEDPADDITLPYVTFRAEETGSTLGLATYDQYYKIQYSTDKTTWNTMYTSTIVNLSNIGDEVYIRGKVTAATNSATQFKMTGKIAAYGNCNAIWNYEDLNATLYNNCGKNLFKGCTALTKAPVLPATTLADYCYQYMFSGCTGLTTAPELPATVLKDYCYSYMFQGCTGLTTAPELPATTLKQYCYQSMFVACKSITKSPVLPAKRLESYCYEQMFSNCSALTEITCLATNFFGSNPTYWWASGVSSSGTFYKDSSMTSWKNGSSGIPSGWTVVNYTA